MAPLTTYCIKILPHTHPSYIAVKKWNKKEKITLCRSFLKLLDMKERKSSSMIGTGKRAGKVILQLKGGFITL